MLRTTLIATVSAIGLAAGAQAAQTPVEKITVDTDLSAIQNETAAGYFTNLSTDLEAAIAERIEPARLVSEETGGSKITVDIDELELSNTWANLHDLSESKLTGIVKISSDVDHSKYDTYTLSVAYPDVIAVLPAGTDVSALTMDSAVYYQSMIDAFADRVVENLK